MRVSNGLLLPFKRYLGFKNVPLYIMGVILPFYSLIDMLESAINVLSDACVTACVEKDTNPVTIPVKTRNA